MNLRARIRGWLDPVVALAFDEETLWSAQRGGGDIRRDALCLALDKKSRRVRAVGEAARKMAGDLRFAGSVEIVSGLGQGTVADHDVAEARFRHELRAWPASPLRMAPRVVVASPAGEIAKRALAAALVNAGARDVITLPRVMAAALGAEARVDDRAPLTIMLFDGDWAAAALIARNSIVATAEGPDGLAALVLDKVVRRRVRGDRAPVDFLAETARLRREGLAEDDEAGLFHFERLRERLRIELQARAPDFCQAAEESPLWLAGSCACVPGAAAFASRAWGRAANVPPRPEEAVIRGARKVLGELVGVMRSFRADPA